MQFKQWVKSGAIFPSLVLPIIGLAVVGMLGFIVRNAMANHGLMPQPAVLKPYVCDGYTPSLTLQFGHGKDILALQVGDVKAGGTILNGKITWNTPVPAVNQALPAAVEYDAPSQLRILDAAGVAHSCSR